MTVRLEGTIKRWVGLSSDVKPALGLQADGSTITSADLPAGSSFMESDTGRIYRWDGASWTVSLPVDEQLYVLEAILSELKEFRQMVELAVSD